MKIGIFCGATGYGGSQNTTSSFAMEFHRRGHEVTLFIDKKRFGTYEPIGKLQIVDLPLSWTGNVQTIQNYLRTIANIKSSLYDVLISVSVFHLSAINLCNILFGVPCFHYEVGTATHRIMKYHRGLHIVNSEETRSVIAKYTRKGVEQIKVIKARINLDKYYVKNQFQSNNSSLITIALISRLHPTKIKGIFKILDAVKILYRKGKNIKLDIIGGGPSLFEVKKFTDIVNNDFGCEVVECFGSVIDIKDYIEKCNIAIGLGRSAWECMAMGKPTIVIGNEGLGGIVCKENLKKLMHYNFTARGSKKGSIKEITNELSKMIDKNDLRKELGEFSLKVVSEQYDVKIGASQFEALITNYTQEEDNKLLLNKISDFIFLFYDFILVSAKQFLRKILGRVYIDKK